MEELKISIAEQGKITTNLETLKSELTEIAGRYKGVLVTEDTVPLAKKDLAELRKVRTEIEDRRKAVKKQWDEPLKAFENEVKDALSIIDKPISEIDKQVKDFEQAEKEEKKAKIKEIYDTNVADEYKPFLPYEKVFDEKWLNKSTKAQEIIADLSTKITQIRIDIDAIKALNSEIEDKCLEAYKTGGMAAAIQRNTDYLNAKQAAEEKARLDAERKLREEQIAREMAEQAAKESEEKAIKEEVIEDLPFKDDLPFPEETLTIRIFGSDDIRKVKVWTISEHISFEVVEG